MTTQVARSFEFSLSTEADFIGVVFNNIKPGQATVIVPHLSGAIFVGNLEIDFSRANVSGPVVCAAASFARGEAFTLVMRADPPIGSHSRWGRENADADADADFSREQTPDTPRSIDAPLQVFDAHLPPQFVRRDCTFQCPETDNTVVWSFHAQPGFSVSDQSQKEDKDERPQKRKREAPVQKPNTRIHRLPLYDYHMDDISARHKTMEARIFDGIFAQIRAGDVIEFFNKRRPQPVLVRVARVTRYKNFRDMFAAEGVAPFMPRKATLTVMRAVNEYLSFPKYRDKEASCGVVALQLDANINQDRRAY